MKMFSGSLIAIALLATFHTQDEVFGQSSTISATPSSLSASVTQSRNAGVNSTKHIFSPPSPTPTTSTGTPTSKTSTKPTSKTPTKPTSEIPDSNKTCGKMTVTIHTAQEQSNEDVNTTIQDGLFSNSAMYEAVEITNMINVMKEEQIEVTFNFCLVFKSESGYIEDFAEKQFKMLFNATKIVLKLEESGVDVKWSPAEGECKKCSDGGGGPFNIEPKCKSDSHSCNGLKFKPTKSENCVKYCGDSGAVSIVASFFILPVGMAMSLSFYLWE